MSNLIHVYKATIATGTVSTAHARITVPAHKKCFARVTVAGEGASAAAPFMDVRLVEGSTGGTLAATSSVKKDSLDTETPVVLVGALSGTVPTGGSIRDGGSVGPQGQKEFRPIRLSGGSAGTTMDIFITTASSIAGQLKIEIDE